MKVSLPDNRDVGEAVGDSNEGMKEAYDVGQAEMRINSAKERMRAEAEGARDAGKITESGNQGFGGPGSSRTVKAPKPAVVTKEELAKSGYDNLRDYLNAKQGLTRRKDPKSSSPKLIDPSNIRSGPRFDDEGLIDPSNIRSGRREFEESQIAPAPVDVTKLSLAERMKMKSGGSVSSASKRADGIATKGKTRGRLC
jgi:hypothetical protein